MGWPSSLADVHLELFGLVLKKEGLVSGHLYRNGDSHTCDLHLRCPLNN